MRKNGASAVPSPSAAVTEAMPSSISCLGAFERHPVHVGGWFWVWVPTVWPASRHLAHAFRIGLGLRRP